MYICTYRYFPNPSPPWTSSRSSSISTTGASYSHAVVTTTVTARTPLPALMESSRLTMTVIVMMAVASPDGKKEENISVLTALSLPQSDKSSYISSITLRVTAGAACSCCRLEREIWALTCRRPRVLVSLLVYCI